MKLGHKTSDFSPRFRHPTSNISLRFRLQTSAISHRSVIWGGYFIPSMRADMIPKNSVPAA